MTLRGRETVILKRRERRIESTRYRHLRAIYKSNDSRNEAVPVDNKRINIVASCIFARASRT